MIVQIGLVESCLLPSVEYSIVTRSARQAGGAGRRSHHFATVLNLALADGWVGNLDVFVGTRQQ